MLGEAYLLSGQLDKAREVANHALDVSTEVGFSLGVGWSHQVFGRIAQSEGLLSEAERHLTEAVRIFVQTGARFEIGRTHLFLASVAHAQGDREAATAQLNEAHAVFRALQAPKYAERTGRLAKEFAASFVQ
jgi:tetratricopeptide (TPR) repeat protein